MTRKKKTEQPIDEEANRKALDEAAGVVPLTAKYAPPELLGDMRSRGIVHERPPNAAPLLKTDTREKLLYKIACAGTPLGSDFFDQFPDRQEILELSLDISARLLIVAICNSEMAATQRIASMRVVAALAGKTLPSEEEQPTKSPIPGQSLDAASAARSIDKIRAMTKMEQ